MQESLAEILLNFQDEYLKKPEHFPEGIFNGMPRAILEQTSGRLLEEIHNKFLKDIVGTSGKNIEQFFKKILNESLKRNPIRINYTNPQENF